VLLASSCPSDGRLKIFDSGAGGAHLDIEDGRVIPRLQRLTAELLADTAQGTMAR
jgi:hypothetical protein